jgi:hypothetical protein
MLYKRIAALMLTLVFLAQAFSRYFIVADYYLDTAAYIAKCINKDRPQMHCNGRCQLCKKLQAQDNTDKQNPERRPLDDGNQPLSVNSSFCVFTAIHIFALSKNDYQEIPPGKPVGMPRTLFHPPGNLPA